MSRQKFKTKTTNPKSPFFFIFYLTSTPAFDITYDTFDDLEPMILAQPVLGRKFSCFLFQKSCLRGKTSSSRLQVQLVSQVKSNIPFLK